LPAKALIMRTPTTRTRNVVVGARARSATSFTSERDVARANI
jgi:hypothetical protein